VNGSSINPERAWQMALDQLHKDMPKVSFETWVSNTYFVAFEDGVFTVGTPGAYCREWLASRLTSPLPICICSGSIRNGCRSIPLKCPSSSTQSFFLLSKL
jgi:hypothetical protein